MVATLTQRTDMEVEQRLQGDDTVRRSSIEKAPVMASPASDAPVSLAFGRLPEEIIEQ
jgi:hypothetical protein